MGYFSDVYLVMRKSDYDLLNSKLDEFYKESGWEKDSAPFWNKTFDAEKNFCFKGCHTANYYGVNYICHHSYCRYVHLSRNFDREDFQFFYRFADTYKTPYRIARFGEEWPDVEDEVEEYGSHCDALYDLFNPIPSVKFNDVCV